MNKEDLQELVDSYKSFSLLEQRLILRISEIYKIIGKAFKTRLNWWDYKNGDCEIDGHFEENYVSGELFDGGEAHWVSNGQKIAIIDGGEFNFSYGEFPIEWLYSDFEDILNKGIVEYNEKKEKEKLKLKESRETKQKLKEEAIKKLTPAERKLLGIK
jgi:hypothetical protein